MEDTEKIIDSREFVRYYPYGESRAFAQLKENNCRITRQGPVEKIRMRNSWRGAVDAVPRQNIIGSIRVKYRQM